jgi:transposase
MVRALSEDLRKRVVRRVEAGHSCREVAETFGVSVASVVRWSQRKRQTGSVAAKPMAPGIRARWRGSGTGCCAGLRPSRI